MYTFVTLPVCSKLTNALLDWVLKARARMIHPLPLLMVVAGAKAHSEYLHNQRTEYKGA